jgi:hypothetical protein
LEEQLQKYKWYKCIADPAQYGPGHFYYTQTETGESSWTEPTEPYWIWDAQAGAVDSAAGLQIPGKPQGEPKTRSDKPKVERTRNSFPLFLCDLVSQQQQQLSIPDDYQGYNPKIHGNYDPNASYAKFHTRRAAPGTDYTNILDSQQQNVTLIPDQTATDPYASTMILNRFTGATQTGADLGPERHSDAAKSGRQMNAFFDVDAAANAHDGRSLKAERQAQKLTKQQVKEFNSKRAERKHKKRMQQLLS